MSITEEQTREAMNVQNSGYLTTSALQLRLETDSKIESVQMFLSGERSWSYVDPKTQKVIVKKFKVGKKLMNDEGVAHLTNYMSAIINPQVVQGNYDEQWYRDNLELTHKRLAYMITVNRFAWEIDINSRHSIIGFLMEYVKPFLSRLLDNKERESYASTIRSVESSSMQQNQSGGMLGFR